MTSDEKKKQTPKRVVKEPGADFPNSLRFLSSLKIITFIILTTANTYTTFPRFCQWKLLRGNGDKTHCQHNNVYIYTTFYFFKSINKFG